MAKPTKSKSSAKKPAEKARVVSVKSSEVKQPRIRKVETVRDRTAKETAKAEAKANKQPKRHVRRAARVAVSPLRPLKKPAYVLAWPARTRPVKFFGRFVGRLLWPRYFRNSWKEVRQVTWPTRRETWKMTFAVIIFAVAFGLAAAGTDLVLDKVIRRIVFRG